MSLEISIFPNNIAFLHLVFTKLDTPKKNLLICDLESTTIYGAYMERWVNFNLYSWTNVELYFKFINFWALASLNSLEKNMFRKSLVK